MITIVDYQVGNIQAFLNVYKRLNIPAATADSPTGLERATKVILPGVGDFDQVMGRLTQSGLRQTLDQLALERRVPLLGVCVGMQMLGRSSEEGQLPGLGWIAGDVKRFTSPSNGDQLPLPHMGWNDVRPSSNNRLFNQLESEARFYFLHSYYFHCDRAEDVAAVAVYGSEFCCAVNAGNIFGVQFHPEKSHQWGSRLLQNFAAL